MTHPLHVADGEWLEVVYAARMVQLLKVALRHQMIVVRSDPTHGVNVELNEIYAAELIRRGAERGVVAEHLSAASATPSPSAAEDAWLNDVPGLAPGPPRALNVHPLCDRCGAVHGECVHTASVASPSAAPAQAASGGQARC